MKLKFWYKIQAKYQARKNAKSATIQVAKVKAYSIADALNMAANALKLTGKPIQWQVISINETPFKNICL